MQADYKAKLDFTTTLFTLAHAFWEHGARRTTDHAHPQQPHQGGFRGTGRLGHRNGAGPEGTEVVDGREEQEQRSGRVAPQRGAQTNIASMFGRPELVGAPGRQKAAKRQKVVSQ